MKITKESIRNLIIYGLIGGFSALLDWGVKALLHEVLGMNEFVANVISVHCGIFTSFMLNRHINYKKKDKTAKRFASLCDRIAGTGIVFTDFARRKSTGNFRTVDKGIFSSVCGRCTIFT